MKKVIAIAIIAAAGAIAGCAAADPASRHATAAGIASPAAAVNDEEISRTGSLLKPKPNASQPVKGIGNRAWRDEHEKPQPMPAGG